MSRANKGDRVACPNCGSSNTGKYAQTRMAGDLRPDPWHCWDCEHFWQPPVPRSGQCRTNEELKQIIEDTAHEIASDYPGMVVGPWMTLAEFAEAFLGYPTPKQCGACAHYAYPGQEPKHCPVYQDGNCDPADDAGAG